VLSLNCCCGGRSAILSTSVQTRTACVGQTLVDTEGKQWNITGFQMKDSTISVVVENVQRQSISLLWDSRTLLQQLA
jgi:hypothetical protein